MKFTYILILITFLAPHADLNQRGPIFFKGVRSLASSNNPDQCKSWLKTFFANQENKSRRAQVTQALKKYIGEVKETKGLRLFLKNIEHYRPERKYIVFLPYKASENLKWYSHPFNRAFQYFPKKITTRLFGSAYEFYPLSGMTEFFVGKPLRKITQQLLKEEKEFTLLLSAPVSFGIFWITYDQFDEYFQESLKNHLNDQIQKDAKNWDKLIQSEFSLNGIKMLLEEGKLTPAEARQKAYQYVRLLNDYYKTMNDIYPKMTQEDQYNWALNHPLFSDIKRLSLEGIKEGKEYIYQNDFKDKLSKEKIDELLDSIHALYATDNIISDMIQNPDDLHYDQSVVNIRNQIRNNSYSKYLFQLNKTGQISKEELTYRLQEDAFWQTRFKKWEIVRVIKRKKVQGQYTSESLQLDDIRQEVIEEIVSSHKEQGPIK